MVLIDDTYILEPEQSRLFCLFTWIEYTNPTAQTVLCALGSSENEFVAPFFMGQPNKCSFLDPECLPSK